MRFPLFFRRHEFRPDSGGDGRYRGGPGGELELAIETAEPAVGNTAGDGVKYGACGMLGGQDGEPHRYVLQSSGRRIARSRPRRPASCSGPADVMRRTRAAAAAGAIRPGGARRSGTRDVAAWLRDGPGL